MRGKVPTTSKLLDSQDYWSADPDLYTLGTCLHMSGTCPHVFPPTDTHTHTHSSVCSILPILPQDLCILLVHTYTHTYMHTHTQDCLKWQTRDPLVSLWPGSRSETVEHGRFGFPSPLTHTHKHKPQVKLGAPRQVSACQGQWARAARP